MSYSSDSIVDPIDIKDIQDFNDADFFERKDCTDRTELLTMDHRSVAKLLDHIAKITVCDANIHGTRTEPRTEQKTEPKSGKVPPFLSKKSTQLNKMMDHISWKLGDEPQMILNGEIMPADCVAVSILEQPLINKVLSCVIVETVRIFDENNKTNQYIGGCIYENEEFTSRRINCYKFIDWVNLLFAEKNNPYRGLVVKKIMLDSIINETVILRIIV